MREVHDARYCNLALQVDGDDSVWSKLIDLGWSIGSIPHQVKEAVVDHRQVLKTINDVFENSKFKILNGTTLLSMTRGLGKLRLS